VAKAKADSNMGMVRQAMEDIGAGAKPLALQAHIKEKFGKELPTQIISNYKFQIRKKGGAKGRGRRAVAAGGGGGGALQDVESIRLLRGLVTQLGARKVKELVDVLE
jgi:hypothetical protein